MHRFRLVPRAVRSHLRLEAGERALAAARDPHGGHVVATTLALHVLSTESYERMSWEEIEHAEWDREAEVLRITLTMPYGEPVSHRVVRLEETPDRLLQAIRERITASVLVDRKVPLRGDLGVRVVGRRRPAGQSPMTWALVFDPGLDPYDTAVYDAAQAALAEVQTEVEP